MNMPDKPFLNSKRLSYALIAGAILWTGWVASILLGKGGDKPKSALTQCKNWRAVRTAKYTFVAERKAAGQKTDMFFYDNEKDPYQKKQIRKGEGADEIFDELHKELRMWLLQTRDRFLYFV